MDDVEEDLRKMAELIRKREFREKELLTACFIIENPEVPIEEIVVVTHVLKDGGVAYQVRQVSTLDYDGNPNIQ